MKRQFHIIFSLKFEIGRFFAFGSRLSYENLSFFAYIHFFHLRLCFVINHLYITKIGYKGTTSNLKKLKLTCKSKEPVKFRMTKHTK